MNLIQLRYFLDSASNENFSKTAEKYMVPTSSVSASIKKLEQEIDVCLFDRTSNKITLNKEGRHLAAVLENAFKNVKSAVAEIQENKIISREIRILVLVRRNYFTLLLIEYQKSHPEIKFRMSHDGDTQDVDAYDLIITEKNDTLHASMNHFLFCIEEICIKTYKENPLCEKKLTLHDLQKQPFVMIKGNNTGINRILQHASRRNGFSPDIILTSEDRSCILKCVENGMGLTLGSRRSLQEDIQQNLTALQVTDFNEYQDVYVYHHPKTQGDRYIQDLLDFLQTKAAQYGALPM